MAMASKTEIWDASIESIYNVLIDYNSYKQFVDGVSDVKILDSSEEGARVQFGLNLIKKFSYILKLKHERPTKVSWNFESGDIFKQNSGSWELKDLGDGKTEVTYNLEVDIKGFVPKAIVNGLTTKNLPAMMNSYHQRAKGN